MPVDFWLVIESVGFLIAIALVAYGVAKFDVRLIAAGGAGAAIVWLLAAWSNSDEQNHSERLEYKTLRLQLVDETTAERVLGATIQVADLDKTGQQMHYRLPSKAINSADGNPSDVITVSFFVQRRINGSLMDQYRRPAARIELVDQTVEIVAHGYLPWRGSSKELLSDARSNAPAETPIVVELRRRETSD